MIAEEVLGRLLNHAFGEGIIDAYQHARNCPRVTHLLYADDLIIFLNGTKSSCKACTKLLKTYEVMTGQRVNNNKYAVFFQAKAVDTGKSIALSVI